MGLRSEYYGSTCRRLFGGRLCRLGRPRGCALPAHPAGALAAAGAPRAISGLEPALIDTLRGPKGPILVAFPALSWRRGGRTARWWRASARWASRRSWAPRGAWGASRRTRRCGAWATRPGRRCCCALCWAAPAARRGCWRSSCCCGRWPRCWPRAWSACSKGRGERGDVFGLQAGGHEGVSGRVDSPREHQATMKRKS